MWFDYVITGGTGHGKVKTWNNSELTKKDEVTWRLLFFSNGLKKSVNAPLSPFDHPILHAWYLFRLWVRDCCEVITDEAEGL